MIKHLGKVYGGRGSETASVTADKSLLLIAESMARPARQRCCCPPVRSIACSCIVYKQNDRYSMVFRPKLLPAGLFSAANHLVSQAIGSGEVLKLDQLTDAILKFLRYPYVLYSSA